ncbi:TetR/AcrR family transcriptional regulator [Paenibacillus cisolokensis]|uniref:TetR/AcrR family transcriptional regulator n=1 Tax=Paenibacillus cisolokensis TaxID=1658519 RepID=UPI003D2B80AF
MYELTDECSMERSIQAMKSALIELILDQGYDQVTLSDIVRKAGIHPDTFREHFADKDALLEQVTSDFLNSLGYALIRPYVRSRSLHAKQMAAEALRIFRHIYEHRQVFQALLAAPANLYQRLYSRIRSHQSTTIRLLSDQPEEIDDDLMISYTITTALGLVMEWARQGFKATAADMVRQLNELVGSRLGKPVCRP